MPKILSPFSPAIASLLLILQIFTNTAAQLTTHSVARDEVQLRVSADKQVWVDIRNKVAPSDRPKDLQNIWFLDQFAGVNGLDERRSIVYLYDHQGYLIARQRFTAGGHVRGMNIGGLKYTVDLTPLLPPSAAAHVSWAGGDAGVLMLDDLLPQSVGRPVKVKIEVPAPWKVFSTEPAAGINEYAVADIEKAVFVVGQNWREIDAGGSGMSTKLLISGEWLFTDDEAAKFVAEVASGYQKVFGRAAHPIAHVAVTKFPGDVRSGNWEAGSRGRNITILSSDMPFKSQSLQRLHEQLRHELFHLWIPNGVKLSGNYDWFYEGFALYASLKLGVTSGRIRFADFLDTLSRAYNIDISQSPRRSLIEASKNRWAGANTQVYARGMLVAFLCDLALLEKSNGKASVINILREIYDAHRAPNTEQDGNAAVLAVLRQHPALVPIIDRNVTGVESIDWTRLLHGAGIEAATRDQIVELRLAAKLNGRQRNLLDKLGYNSLRNVPNGKK